MDDKEEKIPKDSELSYITNLVHSLIYFPVSKYTCNDCTKIVLDYLGAKEQARIKEEIIKEKNVQRIEIDDRYYYESLYEELDDDFTLYSGDSTDMEDDFDCDKDFNY